MRRQSNINIVLAFILLFLTACEKNNYDHGDIIKESDLVPILTDIYIANGLMFIPEIQKDYFADSLPLFNDIIESHGYTRQSMDNTMKYYFFKKPKNLIKIYDQVLGRLSEMESYLEKESVLAEEHAKNIWKSENIYFNYDTCSTDKSRFDIDIKNRGTYILTFSAAFFPDDQSVNPKICAYINKKGSTETLSWKYIKTIDYIKDGHLHQYSLKFTVPADTSFRFSGQFYTSDLQINNYKKHALFENISLNMAD